MQIFLKLANVFFIDKFCRIVEHSKKTKNSYMKMYNNF